MTSRVLIMAGGTGGHVFPALAVADELRSQGVGIEWIGTRRGIEARLVPAANIPLHYISIQGLRGNGALGWVLAPFKLLKAVYEAMQIIKHYQPDVVLGLGGFASGPGGVAAKLLGKPLVIHEQNAVTGLTNGLLAKIANRVLEGFPSSFKPSQNAVWVGNPVRESIEQLAAPAQRLARRQEAVNILVLGGSLGAKSLNTLLPQAFAKIQQDVTIKHQCGVKHIEECNKNYSDAGVKADVLAFIDDMAAVYAWADIVICRAGALTVAELAAAGLAALLIPYPHAVDDHQTRNAESLVNAGAASVMQERDLTVESLTQEISGLISDRQVLISMATQARSLAKIGTAKQIAAMCLEEAAHG